MKVLCPHLWRRAVALAALLGITAAAQAATFSVTPNVVGSTYAGPVTLQITGLTNAEQVAVLHYLDANTNGAVDAGEALIDAFRVTDGQHPMIGGVTNFGMPGDRNLAGGEITAVINHGISLDNIVGPHLFLLASPSNRFAPIAAAFTVTNAPLSQSAVGTVMTGGSPVPGAVVVALRMPDMNFGGAALTDGAGNYSLTLSPGAYGIMPTKPGYFTDQTKAAMVILTNGIATTNQLTLSSGSVTISGMVTNLANGTAIGGLFLQVEAEGLFAIAFTDTNGVYTAGVAPGAWEVSPGSDRLPRRGLVGYRGKLPVDASTSVANASFGLPRANAMVYGRITVASNAPLAQVSFYAEDSSHTYDCEGFSNTNGDFFIPVLAGTNTWHVGLSDNNNDTLLANAIVSSVQENLTLATNQALPLNFNVLPATATIIGRVRDRSGNAVTNLGISAYTFLGGVLYNTAYVYTDNSGNFSLAAADGTWTLHPDCCGPSGLENRQLVDVLPRLVTIPPGHPVVDLTVYPLGTPGLILYEPAPSGAFSFLVSGAAGFSYTVQFSTNLAPDSWKDLYTTNLQGNYQLLGDPQPAGPTRFYRVRKN